MLADGCALQRSRSTSRSYRRTKASDVRTRFTPDMQVVQASDTGRFECTVSARASDFSPSGFTDAARPTRGIWSRVERDEWRRGPRRCRRAAGDSRGYFAKSLRGFPTPDVLQRLAMRDARDLQPLTPPTAAARCPGHRRVTLGHRENRALQRGCDCDDRTASAMNSTHQAGNEPSQSVGVPESMGERGCLHQDAIMGRPSDWATARAGVVFPLAGSPDTTT